MPGHDLIVIGASAGGVEALIQLVRGLPSDLPAAICVVLHVPAHGSSVLPTILSRAKTLPACHAEDGQELKHGHIYVAPPDHHLLVRGHRLRLSRGATENGARPAVDPLFRSAARSRGACVIGVVLSGSLDDGTAGLMVIKAHKGLAVVQDPNDALYPGMPQSAVEHVEVDCVAPVAQIAALLTEMARSTAPADECKAGRTHATEQHDDPKGWSSMDDELEQESDVAEGDMKLHPSDVRPGKPSGFTCPECHGALWEMHEGDLIRFRCQVGHAYSGTTLLAEQSEALEIAMWTAYRALRESYQLARRLEKRSAEKGHDLAAMKFGEQADNAERRANVIRDVLAKGLTIVTDDMEAVEPVAHAERRSRAQKNDK